MFGICSSFAEIAASMPVRVRIAFVLATIGVSRTDELSNPGTKKLKSGLARDRVAAGPEHTNQPVPTHYIHKQVASNMHKYENNKISCQIDPAPHRRRSTRRCRRLLVGGVQNGTDLYVKNAPLFSD